MTTATPQATLEAYSRRLGDCEPLPHDEQRALLERAQEGDIDAHRELVRTNLRLAWTIASQMNSFSYDFEELVQCAAVGLTKAVQRFDLDHSTNFTTYAGYWIRAQIQRYQLRAMGVVKIGGTRWARKVFYGLSKARSKLRQEGTEPTPDVLAEHLGVTTEQLAVAQRAIGNGHVPLDKPRGDEDGQTIGDVLLTDDRTPEDAAAADDMQRRIRALLDDFAEALSDRERDILWRRMVADEPMTLREMGRAWGCSHERIRQVEAGIRERLRAHFETELPAAMER